MKNLAITISFFVTFSLLTNAQFLPCPSNSWQRTIYRHYQEPLKPANTYTQAAEGFINDVAVICVLKFEYMYPASDQWFSKPWLGGATESVDPAPIYAMGKDRITFKYKRSRLLTAIPFPIYSAVYDYVKIMLCGPNDVNFWIPQNKFCKNQDPINLRSFTKFVNYNVGALPEWVIDLKYFDHNQQEVPNGIINPSTLLAGQYTWRVQYNDTRISHGNKEIRKYISFEIVSPPSIAFTSNIPDTIFSNAPILNLSNYLSLPSSGNVTSPTAGVLINGSNISFNPSFAGVGPKLITIKATNVNGCDSTIFEPIYVKYNPGTPNMPTLSDQSTINFISDNRIEQHIVSTIYQLQCGTAIGCVPAMTNYTQIKNYSSTTGWQTTLAIYYYYYQQMQGYFNSTYVCDGKSYSLKVLNPVINQPNPLNNLTYHWYKENAAGVQSVGTGINYNLQVADNDSDDVFTMYVSAKNYLGVESPKYPMKVNTKAKYHSVYDKDTLCYSNVAMLDLPLWSDYVQYPSFSDTGAVGQSLVLWNNFYCRGVEAYNSLGTLISQNDSNSLEIPLTPMPIQKVGLKLSSKYPYYLWYDEYNYGSGNYTTPPAGLTGYPSPWRPVTGIPYYDLGCDCETSDTVLFAKNPVLSFVINADTLSNVGSLVNVLNSSEYTADSYWNFFDGNYSYNSDPYHYLYDPGCQDLYYVESNQFGCYSDTTAYCYTIVPEAYLSAEENAEAASSPVLYPSPFTDNITLASQEEISSISMIDAMGKKVYESKQPILGGQEINLSFLSPGIYFASLISSTKTYTIKIVKQ